MLDVAIALQRFYSSFGIKAYEEHTVPKNAALPYITYELEEPDWREETTLTANVWYSGTSYKPLYSKVDEISDKIGEGLLWPADGGHLYLYKGSPFAQVADTGNDNVKVVYLTIGMHALCK
ncbi:MAG: hypothetical protein MSH24_06315 [Lachnospiraceae bacterium]|nr:hypothetical protein [Lachnospiraceae bacterium]